MITQSSTVVTINTSEQRRANSQVLMNALKPETLDLISSGKESGAAMKRSKVPWKKKSPARMEMAAHLKETKKKIGSKALRTKLREPISKYNPPGTTDYRTGRYS